LHRCAHSHARTPDDLDPDLNGCIVSTLLDLEAVEAAALMKRAFAADRVSVEIAGDWAEIRFELGLPDGETAPRARLSDFDRKAARRRLEEIGRNDPCWCGSGRKYKHCHMRDDGQTARG
jgi:preprotein translocase subunit SecA